MAETLLDAVRQGMRQKAPRRPGPHDKVYKDECMFSFDTPLSPGGLYINLHTWQAFGAEYVAMDATRSGNALYLRQTAHKVLHRASALSRCTVHARAALPAVSTSICTPGKPLARVRGTSTRCTSARWRTRRCSVGLNSVTRSVKLRLLCYI